jgi:hypothetical protein
MRLPAGTLMEKTQTKKIKTAAAVFELPQRLGILQYVEYEPPPREWCSDECLYEGMLTAEGCRKGVCIKYRVWVHSRDRRRWEAKERWRRRRDEEAGGCIRQQVADALWELSEKYEVGVWYERDFCGVVVNGVRLDQPHCRTAEECIRQILEDYKKEVERMREPPPPPPPDPAEEEYKVLVEKYAWLRHWRKDIVVEYLKREKKQLLETLEKLANPEVPDIVPLFLSLFDVSLGCGVEVYRGIEIDEYCISFCVKDIMPRIMRYCYSKGGGWRPLEGTLRPFKVGIIDGRLCEIYVNTLSTKRYVRIV